MVTSCCLLDLDEAFLRSIRRLFFFSRENLLDTDLNSDKTFFRCLFSCFKLELGVNILSVDVEGHHIFVNGGSGTSAGTEIVYFSE